MKVSGAIPLYLSFPAHSNMVQFSTTAVHKIQVTQQATAPYFNRPVCVAEPCPSSPEPHLNIFMIISLLTTLSSSSHIISKC